MKKSIKLFLGLAIILFSGCIKDNEFEKNKYGINVEEIKGIAFPQASASPVVTSITGQAAALTVAGPIITLEIDKKPGSSVTAQLEVDQTLLTPAITPLPAGSFTVSPLSVTIPGDQKQTTQVKITITNSNTLDPTKIYGVGLKISSVDGGYKIAGNMSKIIMAFSIKNKYDGIYSMKGNHNRVPYNYRYDQTMHMVTVGPSSVIFYWPTVSSNGHPIGTGPDPSNPNNVSWYGGGIAPVVVFDQATDIVTSVYNNPPNPTPITRFDGATGGNVSRYEATPQKRIIVHWNYNNNPARAFFDTLTYVGPRP